ncbi:MAG: sulfotransferase [Rhizobiaceae bacterium]
MFASHGLRYASCELEIRRAGRLAKVSPQMPDPVFIVGHWRSGTTLLANLLSLDSGYFFPTLLEVVSPHDFFPSSLEKISRRLIPLMFPALRPMDTAPVPLRRPFPQEDEMAMAAIGAPSFFNAFYFPAAADETISREVFFDGLRQYEIDQWVDSLDSFWRKLSLLHPSKRPLVKNPAHAARIPILLNRYPPARFILVRRDPDDVRASMQRLFEHLWADLALQRYDTIDVRQLVEKLNQQMSERIDRDWAGMSGNQGLEISFDDLLAAPETTVEMVQNWLGRSVEADHLRAIKSYLAEFPVRRK